MLSEGENLWSDNFVQVDDVLELRKNTYLLVSNEPEIIERFSSYSIKNRGIQSARASRQ